MNRYSIRVADVTSSVCRYLVFTDTPFGLIIDQELIHREGTEIQVCPMIDRQLVDDPIVALRYKYLDSNYPLLAEIDRLINCDISGRRLDIGAINVDAVVRQDPMTDQGVSTMYYIDHGNNRFHGIIQDYRTIQKPIFTITSKYICDGIGIIKSRWVRGTGPVVEYCSFYSFDDAYANVYHTKHDDALLH